MTNQRRMVGALIFIAVLIFFAIYAGYYLGSPPGGLMRVLATGIISSLMAAIVYGVITVVLLYEPLHDRTRIEGLFQEFRNRELRPLKQYPMWSKLSCAGGSLGLRLWGMRTRPLCPSVVGSIQRLVRPTATELGGLLLKVG